MEDWEETLNQIRVMRSHTRAPVDTMGCYALAEKVAEPKVFRYQVLVGLLLSSQTRDEVTFGAVRRLQQLPLVPGVIAKESEEKLAELIKPVGFYRRKAASLKNLSQILVDQYKEDIPTELKDLLGLPGIGPKMAYLALQNAWGRSEGIGVDVHVHRICGRLGWTKGTTPESARKELESWLPREHWAEINPLLVGFGQTVCLPIKPRCHDCMLKDSCPSSII